MSERYKGKPLLRLLELYVLDAGNDQLQIKVLDDTDNTCGFLIITGKDIDNPNSEAFDNWVSSQEELKSYFNESNWVIKWL